MAGPSDAVFEWLDGAAETARRARSDPRDGEALHRFRINARRLLVYLGVARKSCGVPAKLRKRLRRALRATGPTRDARVAELWLGDYADGRLFKAVSRSIAPAPLGPAWERDVGQALRKIRRAAAAAVFKKSELRAAQRAAAEKAWRRLTRRLRRLSPASDEAALHKARVAVKKLKYMVESMERVPRDLPPAAGLRRLQRVLGDVHDRDVIACGLGAAAGVPGLAPSRRAALARLARERRGRLAAAERCWADLLAGRR